MPVIDFHNHLVPGVDDGAATPDETRAAMAAMYAQGVRCIITTPHFSASSVARPDELAGWLAQLEPAWEQARRIAAEFPGLRLERGVEAALDTPEPDFPDPRLRLAGTDFVLVEFPFMQVPPNGKGALFQITAPVDLFSAMAYGAVNSSTRKMAAFPEIAAAPTTTPPEPGLGASSFRCHTTCPVFASNA